MEKLINNFISNYPDLVKEMQTCYHSFRSNGMLSPNPYHLEDDVWSHTMLVCKEAEQMNDNVKIASLLHDIGKTKVRQEFDPDKNKVRFIGHGGVSFWMAIDILNKMDLSEADKVHILKLINFHDILFDYITEDAVRYSKIEKIFVNQSELFKNLARLSYCDTNGRIKLKGRNIDDDLIRGLLSLDIQNKERTTRPYTITMLIGIPCSGKSTYLSNSTTDDTIISRDSIILECYGSSDYNSAWNSVNHAEVDTKLNLKFKNAMKNRENIVIDMTNISKKSRKKFLGQIPNKEYHKKAIVFVTGLDEINKRNTNRPNKYIPDEVYLKMMTGFSYPTYDEFDEIVEVM